MALQDTRQEVSGGDAEASSAGSVQRIVVTVLAHKIYCADLWLKAWAESRFVIPPEFIAAKQAEMDECAWGILAALSDSRERT